MIFSATFKTLNQQVNKTPLHRIVYVTSIDRLALSPVFGYNTRIQRQRANYTSVTNYQLLIASYPS